MQTWDRQGTALSQIRRTPYPSYTTLSQWEKFNQRKRQRGYPPILPYRSNW